MSRALALALTVVTGASGLVYEVAWQKYLATLLGSHAEATAAVLGLFLAGLSLGYAVFGTVSRRVVARAAQRGVPPPLLRVYGAVEAGIGVFALGFPLAFAGLQRASVALPLLGEGSAFALDVALSALLVLPPTVLMGGTIPLLTQGLASSVADATRFHALVYAVNTAGACAGALLGGFVLLPWLGLRDVMFVAGVVNLAVGATFLQLGRPEAQAAPAAAEATGEAASGLAPFVAIALLCGFASMAIQTVWNRMAALALGSSPYTFSLVVALFVACIALGSLAVSLAPRIPRRWLVWNLGLLLLWFGALHVVMDDAPFARAPARPRARHALLLRVLGSRTGAAAGRGRTRRRALGRHAAPALPSGEAALRRPRRRGGPALRLEHRGFARRRARRRAPAAALARSRRGAPHGARRARAGLRDRGGARGRAAPGRSTRARGLARPRAGTPGVGPARSLGGPVPRAHAPARALLHPERVARLALRRPPAALLRRRPGGLRRRARVLVPGRAPARGAHQRQARRRDPGRLPDHGAPRAAPGRAGPAPRARLRDRLGNGCHGG